MSTASTIPGRGTFAHGVHPPDCKNLSADAAIEVLPVPAAVKIPLLQHVGTPCESKVKPRQELALGECIADSAAFVSAPIHASLNGQAGLATVATLPNGRHVPAIPITAGPNQPSADELYRDLFGGDWPFDGLESYTPEQILQAVRDGGLVGQGGAAFPTHVKLKPNPQKPIDTILLNGCECEPYLTSDYRLMIEAPRPILSGALLAARAAGASRIFVAVEDNKPRALDVLRNTARGTSIQVVSLKTRYPQGGEKQTIRAMLGRTVPAGGLPLDVGVVVLNVGTAAALARAVLRGKPLTHRVVCVTGRGVKKPANLLVPIGASYRDLIEHCGGLTSEAVRVVAGGPMMGFTIGDLDTPVTKGTSGVVVLTEHDVRRPAETSCVRCGRCVDACPMNLVPTRLALASRAKDWDLLKKYRITLCMECGCCAYVCPAALPLVQLIRMGKVQMPKE